MYKKILKVGKTKGGGGGGGIVGERNPSHGLVANATGVMTNYKAFVVPQFSMGL